MAGQDVAAAISIAENIARQYEVDEDQIKLETLKLAAGSTMPVSSWESAAELAAELASTARRSVSGSWRMRLRNLRWSTRPTAKTSN